MFLQNILVPYNLHHSKGVWQNEINCILIKYLMIWFCQIKMIVSLSA